MQVEVKKRVEKETEKLPIYVQLMAAEEIKKLKAASSTNFFLKIMIFISKIFVCINYSLYYYHMNVYFII